MQYSRCLQLGIYKSLPKSFPATRDALTMKPSKDTKPVGITLVLWHGDFTGWKTEIWKLDEKERNITLPTQTTCFGVVVGSDVGFRRVRNVLKTPLFTWFCAATCILYWCPQYFVNVAFFTAICSVFRRCSKKNAKPSHASAHFAKCVLQKNEMDCLGTYFPHAQT